MPLSYVVNRGIVMTTIVRYKDMIISDSRYLTMVGDMIGTIAGPAKFYKHSSNAALIGIGGGFANKVLYDAVEKDISQAIIDLSNYPKVVPAFTETLKLLSDEKQLENAKRDQVPSLLIATKTLTCTVLFCEDAMNKPIVSVYPANIATAIGSGSESIFPLLMSITSREDLIECFRLAIMGDTFSGNDIYFCNFTNMVDISC